MQLHRHFTGAFGFLKIMVIAAAFLLLMVTLATGQTDPGTPGTELTGIGTFLIGLGATLGTKVISSLASQVDLQTGRLDNGFRKKIGPALPAVTVGLAIALPYVGRLLGLNDLPTAELVANSPTSAIIGITLREITRKLLPKKEDE